MQNEIAQNFTLQNTLARNSDSQKTDTDSNILQNTSTRSSDSQKTDTDSNILQNTSTRSSNLQKADTDNNILQNATMKNNALQKTITENNMITLRITDDGTANATCLTSTDTTKHKGIFSITEQIHSLDGTISLCNNTPHGICIQIQIPMKGELSYEYFVSR